jgi:hypothetical protein
MRGTLKSAIFQTGSIISIMAGPLSNVPSGGRLQIAEGIKSLQWNYSPSIDQSPKNHDFRMTFNSRSGAATVPVLSFQRETIAISEA